MRGKTQSECGVKGKSCEGGIDLLEETEYKKEGEM